MPSADVLCTAELQDCTGVLRVHPRLPSQPTRLAVSPGRSVRNFPGTSPISLRPAYAMFGSSVRKEISTAEKFVLAGSVRAAVGCTEITCCVMTVLRYLYQTGEGAAKEMRKHLPNIVSLVLPPLSPTGAPTENSAISNAHSHAKLRYLLHA